MKRFSEKEIEFMDKIKKAEETLNNRSYPGERPDEEIEINLRQDGDCADGYYALAYRPNEEQAIAMAEYPEPLATTEYVELNNIDVRRCCDKMKVSYCL